MILVNEALARRYFPHGDALGHVLRIWGANRRIAGIVEDIRDQPADINAVPAFWMPLAQQPFGRIRAAVRVHGDPLALVPAVRAVLQSIDRELPMSEVSSMDEIAEAALAERQFALKVCEAFGLLAIALAGIGVYAMLSYSVEQRKREIGIGSRWVLRTRVCSAWYSRRACKWLPSAPGLDCCWSRRRAVPCRACSTVYRRAMS